MRADSLSAPLLLPVKAGNVAARPPPTTSLSGLFIAEGNRGQLRTHAPDHQQSHILQGTRAGTLWFLAYIASIFATEDIPQKPRAYGQARGVMPLSCAYFAAEASTRGCASA
jgi:hypothetical protein